MPNVCILMNRSGGRVSVARELMAVSMKVSRQLCDPVCDQVCVDFRNCVLMASTVGKLAV